MHEESCFLTLSFSPEHLPKDENVNVRDWQLFAKRLRKAEGPFRFFHCGEYGDKFGRPHYHALIFGKDFFHDRVKLRRSESGAQLYVSEAIAKAWPFGFHSLGDVSYASARYVAAYAAKSAEDKERLRALGRSPEYATASKRPPLGKTWFERYWRDVYPHDYVVVAGRKYRPPPYYDYLLEDQHPQVFEEVFARRVKKARETDSEPERLRSKEKVVDAKARLWSTTPRELGDDDHAWM